MIYGPKEIALKDGRVCVLRSPEPGEAAELIEHIRLTSGETDYMVRYPDEVDFTEEGERELMRKKAQSPNACFVCAYVDGALAGCGGVDPVGERDKLRHRAVFGISVKRAYWRLGLGRAITLACIEAAREAGYEQLELDAVAYNRRAVELYKSCGYTQYGLRPRGFRYRDGTYADEALMALPLR